MKIIIVERYFSVMIFKAGMAAYLRDVDNNMTDITAERIIREKLENKGKKDVSKYQRYLYHGSVDDQI